MSMAVGDNKGGSIADINVTPMADIMIVLLIIFMVITPLLQKGVDRKEEQKTIIVAVRNDANHTIYLGTKKLDNAETELTKQVKERLEELSEDEKLVQLKADQGLDYGDVMKVMDMLRAAGVEDIALIAERKIQG
jgi:biopolymer transport protein TolR